MRELIAFTGLAWNMKSTIAGVISDNCPEYVRLEQVNKKYLAENPNAKPDELLKHFLDSNAEVILNNDQLITDRWILDYLIYDIMMNPLYLHQIGTIALGGKWVNFWTGETIDLVQNAADKFIESLVDFDQVYLINIETSNEKFIENEFKVVQTNSVTSYLFDNPDKYFYYSRLYNNLVDQIMNRVVSATDKVKRYYHKFTESESPIEFQDKVIGTIYNEII